MKRFLLPAMFLAVAAAVIGGRDYFKHAVRNWDPTEEELPRTFMLGEGQVDSLSSLKAPYNVPAQVAEKLKGITLKECRTRKEFIDLLATRLDDEERTRFQANIIHSAALYTIDYPKPLATKDKSDGWTWRYTASRPIRDVYVAAPEWPDAPYTFGVDYSGIIKGDTVTLHFTKSGGYPVKIVFDDAATKSEIQIVYVGFEWIELRLGRIGEARGRRAAGERDLCLGETVSPTPGKPGFRKETGLLVFLKLGWGILLVP
jgi:hypothetical protein